MTFEVAILGRGFAGLSAAWEALKAIPPEKIIIFGRVGVGIRASEVAQGILSNKGLKIAQAPLFQAKLDSLDRVDNWVRQIESLSGRRINRDFLGVYEPFLDEIDYKKVVSRVYKERYYGIYGSNLVKANLPYFRNINYMRYPLDGWIDARELIVTLENHLKSSGCKFVDQDVTEMNFESNLFNLSGTLDSRVQSKRLIVACGAKNSCVLRKLSVEIPKTKTVSGHVLSFGIKGPISQPVAMVKNTNSLIIRKGEALLGSTSWKEQTINQDLHDLEKKSLLTSLETDFSFDIRAALNPKALWGHRELSKDRLPYWGALPHSTIRNLFTIGGLYKSGLQISSLLAEACVADMLGKRVDSLASHFHVSRWY